MTDTYIAPEEHQQIIREGITEGVFAAIVAFVKHHQLTVSWEDMKRAADLTTCEATDKDRYIFGERSFLKEMRKACDDTKDAFCALSYIDDKESLRKMGRTIAYGAALTFFEQPDNKQPMLDALRISGKKE